MVELSSLRRNISPPRLPKRRKTNQESRDDVTRTSTLHYEPSLAAVEAGRTKVEDHVAYFKHHLSKASRHDLPDIPRLSISDFAALYQNNEHPHGNHFVIHQHNHPKAGVHYDLRLQFSRSSSISFAIPKGLPGNPNSRSIGRMAIETRVHNYWNHLIESASSKTGSLLIWDTGTYVVLPRRKDGSKRNNIPSPHTTDGEDDSPGSGTPITDPTENSHENEKLIAAFQSRYIRLQLQGTKLPRNYTVILRLPSNEIIKCPTARRKSSQRKRRPSHEYATSDSDICDESRSKRDNQEVEENLDTDTDEDAQTRLHNAYPGSTNDIGSVHQRHWFLMLDRIHSGFIPNRSGDGAQEWVKDGKGGGFDPFLVRGRDYERSVVTGRLARDVESDEGVEGYVGRGGWVGIEH